MPGTAAAHARNTVGFSEITEQAGIVNYDLSLEYGYLAVSAGLVDPFRAQTDEERRMALTQSHDAIEAFLGARLHLSRDGVACEGTLDRTGMAIMRDSSYAVLELSYVCMGATTGTYELGYDMFRHPKVLGHVNVVDYRLDDQEGRFVLDADHPRFAVGEGGFFSSVASFISLGIEHILSGIDHVLFLLALLLGARRFKSIIKIATTFTVAHSITLALASLGWVQAPSDFVEPSIALSIAYVAIRNIIDPEPKERLPIVFAFGLVHGLGFASTLSFTDGVSWRLILSIFSFNVGIEFGQALVIAIVFPLLLLVRRFERVSAVTYAGATSVIAVFGFMWFVQRVMG